MTFSGDAGEPVWTVVNDDVMGGRSEGGATIAGGQLHFSGTLSLENNGGFASIRAVGRRYDLSGATAMILRVKGDGRKYQLRLTTDARVGDSAVSYGTDFTAPPGQWIEVSIPFDRLRPTHRGKRLEGPLLDLSTIEEIRLLIRDGRAGSFALTVDWIKVR